MAKMFYTLEETAEKLGISDDDVRSMASDGKLTQFRDRDKLMFKRDQVDTLAADQADDADSTDSLELASLDSGLDQIDLADEPAPSANPNEDSRMRTGISVFDADEIELADPLAQTVVTDDDVSDELTLDGVGSGSGLLDLTRESDDTSLGAELLDEIYPGSGEGSDIALDAPQSSGAFDSPISIEPSGTGLDHLGAAPIGVGAAPMAAMPATIVVEPDVYTPAANGFTIGMFIGAAAALIIVMMVGITAIMGTPIEMTQMMTAEENTLWFYVGGTIVGSLIFGFAFLMLGLAKAKSAAR